MSRHGEGPPNKKATLRLRTASVTPTAAAVLATIKTVQKYRTLLKWLARQLLDGAAEAQRFPMPSSQ